MAEAQTVTREQFVREWCADLRSGKFRQNRGQLADMRDPLHCCCLGVACHTAARVGILSTPFPADEQAPNVGTPGNWFHELFDAYDPDLVGSLTCTEANDASRWSFPRIASALEAKYLAGAKS